MTTHDLQEDPITLLDGSHSLWLVVRRRGKCTSYEFPPESDRAVVAGASDRVQIHIARAAPIAFYIERVEDHLCITSCYPGAKLCVNARIMRGRQWLTEPSRIEVAGELLDLRVYDSPPSTLGQSVDASPDRALPKSSAPGSSPPSVAWMGEYGASETACQSEPSLALESAAPSRQQTTDHLEDREPISSSELSSADTPDVFLAAFDDWFDATLLGAALNEEARPKPLEPPWRRASTAPLKQVPVPPRPLGAAQGVDPDCARTLEFAAVRVTSLADGLKTIEFKAPSADSGPTSHRKPPVVSDADSGPTSHRKPPVVSGVDSSPSPHRKPPVPSRPRLAPVLSVASTHCIIPPSPRGIRPELTMRIVPSRGELEADLAVTQPIPRTLELSSSRRAPYTLAARELSADRAAPRERSLHDTLSLPMQRRPLMFLIGAAVGIVLPILCVAGANKLASLPRNGLFPRAIPTADAFGRSIPSHTTTNPRSVPVDAASLAARVTDTESITSTAWSAPSTTEVPPSTEAVTSSSASAAASVSLPL
ncbi:MAG: hypothetical protein ACM3ZE_25005, partial [Myxococcales bacterium]